MSTTRGDWDRGEKFGADWVAAAVARKFEHYRGEVSSIDLLVYVNYVAIEHPYLDLRDKASPFASPFRSVWLLNGNAIACIAGDEEEKVKERAWMFFARDAEQ